METPCEIWQVLDALESPSIAMLYIYNGEISDIPIKIQSSLIIFKHNFVWMAFNSSIWTAETYIPVMKEQNIVDGWVSLTTGEKITI